MKMIKKAIERYFRNAAKSVFCTPTGMVPTRYL